MSDRGFIAIDRGLFDHPTFAPEPFTEREAWVWLIAEAAWKPCKVRIGRFPFDLERGQAVFAMRFLAQRWRWSEPRVRRFIARLTGDALVCVFATRGATVITICNYDKYQDLRRTGDAQIDAQPEQKSTQRRTNNQEPKEVSSLRSDTARDTPRSELAKVVDDDRAKAVVEHRQRLRKPLTARAAQLLAGKLAKADSPNSAADLMIERGWLSFEPGWMSNHQANARGSPRDREGNGWMDALHLNQSESNANVGTDQHFDDIFRTAGTDQSGAGRGDPSGHAAGDRGEVLDLRAVRSDRH